MNICFKHIKSSLIAFPIFVAVLLSGCGGGGGGGGLAASTTISGTAAAGAPIVGTVSVRDSSTNPQPVKTGVPIAADGKYSVDVTGLKAPYAFLADGTVGGKRVQLYSAATQADVGGTISITPFTDLMIRNVAGTLAGTLVDAYITSGSFATLTAAQLDAERVKLTGQLAPVLAAAGLSTSIDLLRAAFNADSTGLDRFMDLVKVDTTVSTAVTITNILDANNKLTVNPQTGVTTGGTTLSAIGITSGTVATPVDLIVQTFNTFSGFFATSLPGTNNTSLLALFSSTFLEEGRNSGVFLTEITSDPTIIGLKLTNVVVDSVNTATGIAQVHFSPVNAAGASLAHDVPGGALAWQMQLDSVSGAWKVHGDQRIARVRVRTEANKSTCNPANTACTMSTTNQTGLQLDVDDKGLKGIGSAVVTGPGLPGGVTLKAQINNTQLSIPCTGSGCPNGDFGYVPMSNTDIGNMGTAPYTYTVKLYNNATTPVLLQTYTEVVPVAPVLNTALSTLAFPSISNINMINLANYAGGTLTPSWTIPAGLWGDSVSVNVYNTATNQSVMDDLQGKTATSGTSTLVITAPGGAWTNGNYQISTWDQYGGKVSTNYQ